MKNNEREKAYVYAEAANGLTVRIPVDSLEEWSKAQDEIRAGTRQPDPQRAQEIREYIERIKKARRER